MSQITWKEFFTVIFFILIAYYITIIMLYYRKAFNLSLLNKIMRLPFTVVKVSTVHTPAAETIYTSITHLIQQAASGGYAKEEILFALNKLLQEGGENQPDNASHTRDINQYIADACQQYCSIHLSEEDLRVLWI